MSNDKRAKKFNTAPDGLIPFTAFRSLYNAHIRGADDISNNTFPIANGIPISIISHRPIMMLTAFVHYNFIIRILRLDGFSARVSGVLGRGLRSQLASP